MADDTDAPDPSVLTIYPNASPSSAAVATAAASAPAATPAQPTAPISPTDRDMAIRTMIGEESDPAGMAGVASTMLNRARAGTYGGSSLSGVALAPGQFEAWSRNPQALLNIAPTDPRYQHAAQIFDAVSSGALPDLTGGATHFYAPAAQAALGRKPPAWATGKPTPLGKTLFFAPNSPSSGNVPAPAVQAINSATSIGPDPMRDFEVAPSAGAPVVASPQAASVTPARDPDPMRDFEVAPPAGVIGPNGLVWNAAGGHDPQSGKLIIAGKPFTEAPTSPVVAATNGFLNGIPIVGPSLASSVQKAAAAVNALTSGTPYDQNSSAFKDIADSSAAAYPKTTLVSNLLGSVGGTIPAMVAAPEAFGIGARGLAANALASAGMGAAIGGGDAGMRSGGDIDAMKSGAETGAAFGGAAPFAGKLAGAGINALSNFAVRTTPAARAVGNMLSTAGLTPQDAQASLNRLGGAGTLADVDPAMTTAARGLSARGGETTSLLKGAMQDRAGGADDRASRLMIQQLGPAPDVEATLQAIKDDAATRAKPYYDAGRAGSPMDVTPILNSINGQLPNASGGIKSILNSVRGFLTNDVATKANPLGMTVPKSDPQAILGARQALDDMMYNRATGDAKLGPNAMRVAGDLRGQIDSVVKSNGSFAQGDSIYSQSKGVESAFQQGQDIFGTNTRPADLARTIAAMPPEQVAALRLGARAAIADSMQSAKRGEGAAAQGLFSRSTNARANLNLLFPNGQDALDALHSEATMRGTERTILGQSATAETTAAMKRWAPQTEPSGISNNLLAAAEGFAAGGAPGAIAAPVVRTGVNNLLSGIRQQSADKLAQGVAKGLVSTGPEQQQFLGQVGRAYRSNVATNALSGAASATANLLTRTVGERRVFNALSGR